jgi:hypothetical protein
MKEPFQYPHEFSVAGHSRERIALAILLSCYFLLCIVSLTLALHYTTHRIAYDPHQLPKAIVSVVAFSVVASPFLIGRFSFGYFVGFYFYTMVFGFIWLSWFTSLTYNLQTARISAVASFIALLLPALFLSVPIRQRLRVSPGRFEHLLDGLFFASAAVVTLGAFYNFRPIGLESIHDFRSTLKFPAPVGYLMGIISSSVLPFLFAAFILQRRPWRTGLTILLLVLLYPITLTKTALFTPAWLAGLAILSRFVEARATAILSLVVPLLAGVVLLALFQENARSYFDIVNFRWVTVPSSALNIYNDYFARHEVTHFCQISFLNKLLGCPDSDALFVIMERTYGLGFLNASLFATEGIASVGPVLAPLVVFACGLVIAVGNCTSHGLPSRFVLLSSAVLPHYFLNVPLTTAMLTHGTGGLFLLWYLTPRTFFEPDAGPSN